MCPAKVSVLGLLLCLSFVTADKNPTYFLNMKDSGTIQHQFSTMNIRNSVMAIATSDESQDSESAFGKYNVSIVTLDGKKEPTTQSCELEFHKFHISIHPFTANKAIVISISQEKAEEQYVKYEIVSFPDCKTIPVKINFKTYEDGVYSFEANHQSVLINEDDTFDVFYNDAKLCGNRICRLTIDARGNKVRGPITSFVPIAHAFKFVKGIPSSSNFILTEFKFNETYRISLIKSDGQVILKEYKGYDDIDEHDVSTSYGSIRICSKTNTKNVDCEVFDYSGKSMSKISVVPSLDVETVTVENLVDGDFLLSAQSPEDAATLVRVKNDGSVNWEKKLSDFPCKAEYQSSIDVKNDQFCVVRRCSNFSFLKIVNECY